MTTVKSFFNTLDNHAVALTRSRRQGATGTPRLATSIRAKPSRWRPSWSREKSSSATAAARWACVAGSPRSTRIHRRDRLGAPMRQGPDKDVLIGPEFKPFYKCAKGQGSRRQHLAAGHLEDRRRHDVGLDSPTIRRSTPSSTAPAIRAHGTLTNGQATTCGRPRCSPAIPTAAPPNGPTVLNPHDLWDYDEINENVLLDLPIDGKTERFSCITGATATCMSSTGRPERFFRPIRYDDDEQLTKGIDLKTGRPIENPKI